MATDVPNPDTMSPPTVEDSITELRKQFQEQSLFQHQSTQALQRAIQQLAQTVELIKTTTPNPSSNPTTPNPSSNPTANLSNTTQTNRLHPDNSNETTSLRNPTLKIDLPKFEGTDPHGWIFLMQEYFQYHGIPEDHRLSYVSFMVTGEASEWLRWMKSNNLLRSWPEFLEQVKLRFDPSHFEDFLGRLSKTCQTTTVSAYRAEYEKLLNKVTGVPETVLILMFIAGLKSTIRREVQRQTPQEDNRKEQQPMENNEEHIFTSDCSNLNSMAGPGAPRSLRLTGIVHGTSLQILIDGGSTHNFIQPKVAEQLQLPVCSISAFRVYIGNGDSLRCTQKCDAVPLWLQDHLFTTDLFILPIKGPDIVLGVQWLQELGKVTHDYAGVSKEFNWRGEHVCLQGTQSPQAKQVSYSHLCALLDSDEIHSCYEISPLKLEEQDTQTNVSWPSDIPDKILEVLQHHVNLFGAPNGLPPRRLFDHHIHLNPGSAPVNITPRRREPLSGENALVSMETLLNLTKGSGEETHGGGGISRDVQQQQAMNATLAVGGTTRWR
nr:Transposon Ty3-G Gag-Pol polyprotein [Ipomoea batatas]